MEEKKLTDPGQTLGNIDLITKAITNGKLIFALREKSIFDSELKEKGMWDFCSSTEKISLNRERAIHQVDPDRGG
jgi:hypothetical protein